MRGRATTLSDDDRPSAERRGHAAAAGRAA